MNGNKNLLILYGEYRSFDIVVKQLKKLDEVDIIFSTWDVTTNGAALGEAGYKQWLTKDTDINNIKKDLPNLKVLVNELKPHINKSVVWKIVHHWKTALNYVEDEYDKIFVHRCDMVSNWDTILTEDLDNESLYIDCHEGWRDDGKLWINDMFFYGKFDVVKNFIESITEPLENLAPPKIHNVMWNNIVKDNRKYIKTNSIRFRIVRWYLESFFNSLNENYIYSDRIDELKKEIDKLEEKFMEKNL